MPLYKNIRRGVQTLGVMLVDGASRGIFPRKLKQRPHARFRSSQRQQFNFVIISGGSVPMSCRAGEIWLQVGQKWHPFEFSSYVIDDDRRADAYPTLQRVLDPNASQRRSNIFSR